MPQLVRHQCTLHVAAIRHNNKRKDGTRQPVALGTYLEYRSAMRRQYGVAAARAMQASMTGRETL